MCHVRSTAKSTRHGGAWIRTNAFDKRGPSSLFFITLKPRVAWCTKSVSLKFDPASEPLHISVKKLFSSVDPRSTEIQSWHQSKVINSGLVGSTDFHSSHPQGHGPEHREGCRESRRSSRDTYPESYITKYTSIRRKTQLKSCRPVQSSPV